MIVATQEEVIVVDVLLMEILTRIHVQDVELLLLNQNGLVIWRK